MYMYDHSCIDASGRWSYHILAHGVMGNVRIESLLDKSIAPKLGSWKVGRFCLMWETSGDWRCNNIRLENIALCGQTGRRVEKRCRPVLSK